MPNIKNLKPFKKGQSGNPSGRTPVSDIRQHLKNRLSETTQDTTVTFLDSIIDRLILTAQRGNVRATELILHYTYGKPKEFDYENTEGITVTISGPTHPPDDI
jgi:hypothetical protein